MTGADVRVGEPEREATGRRLAEHYAQGRLDHEEYAARLDVVWRARTRRELSAALRDLPRLPDRADPRGSASPRWARVPVVPVLLVALALSVGTGQHWWIVAVAWSLAVVVHRTRRRAEQLLHRWIGPTAVAFPSACRGPSPRRRSGPR